jgi:tyrosyl-tRNA synthetase
MKSGFLKEMKSRGYLNQCTDLDGLDSICSNKKITAYIGFDSTAESLHVGSLLQIMILRLLQKHGHQPIILLGGGTTLVGDPSGKDSTRKILKQKEIKKNIAGIKKNFDKLMNKKKNKPIFVNNLDWLSKLRYIDFLRDIGSHFTINKMLTFDSVKIRLDRQQSLSYMEFNYMILQAYDFYQLNLKKNCILQLGGSDQWGNIVNGVELIRRISKKESFGLTSPLITLASGIKMGKTEKGAVWLNEKLFSAYDYWQFWRNTDDRDVKKFLRFFTDLDVKKIDEICQTETDINKLKILLANEATKILHGKQKSEESEKIASETFKLGKLSDRLPEIQIKNGHLKDGVLLLNILVENNISSSKSEARRMIKGRGIKLNNIIVSDEEKKINLVDFQNKKNLKLSFGKKKHFLIKIT